MNPSCRILALSAVPDQALAFIASLRALTVGPGDSLPSDSAAYHPTRGSALSLPHTVPWTISNKYYTADVYFEVHDVRSWCADGSGLAQTLPQGDAPTLPALIFVWARGEPYRDHVQSVATALARSGLDTDVALAVRVPGPQAGNRDDEQTEDDGAVDEFLSSQGFEFIDAHAPIGPSPEDSRQDLSEGIPRLPRVVDALSTIMWPSMQERTDTPRTHMASANGLFGWATRLRTKSARASGPQEEIEALERWLTDAGEAGKFGADDPWVRAISTGSPTDEGPRTPLAMRFDDDFTVFVSSPAQGKSSELRPFDDDDEVGDDTLVSHSGYSYRTLGSVSDFGDEERHQEQDTGDDKNKSGIADDAAAADVDDEEDGDLPTRDEIRATSARIFGSAMLAKFDSAKIPPEGDANDSYDLASLDLSQVVSTLEGMKAEIAGMNDERERRRAAARVALGLVYGLERDPV